MRRSYEFNYTRTSYVQNKNAKSQISNKESYQPHSEGKDPSSLLTITMSIHEWSQDLTDPEDLVQAHHFPCRVSSHIWEDGAVF